MSLSKPTIILIQGLGLKDIPPTLTLTELRKILSDKQYLSMPIYKKNNLLTFYNANMPDTGDTLFIFDKAGALNYNSAKAYIDQRRLISFSYWLKRMRY